MSSSCLSVAEQFKGQTVFLSGVTGAARTSSPLRQPTAYSGLIPAGFYGSCTLERLLRVAPDVHKVGSVATFLQAHMLRSRQQSCARSQVLCIVRSKQGQTPEQRLQRLLASPVFCRHACSPVNIHDKLVDGDMMQPDWGLSPADKAQLRCACSCCTALPVVPD